MFWELLCCRGNSRAVSGKVLVRAALEWVHREGQCCIPGGMGWMLEEEMLWWMGTWPVSSRRRACFQRLGQH